MAAEIGAATVREQTPASPVREHRGNVRKETTELS